MDEKIYAITLADRTVIKKLRLNGNNFISQTAVNPAIFQGNCSPVVISDGMRKEIHQHMELVQVTRPEEECWFVLRDISREELAQIKLQADLAYVAMMAGVTI